MRDGGPEPPRLSASWPISRLPGEGWRPGSTDRAIGLLLGTSLLLGVLVHETGHWLLGRLAGLTPLQMRLHSALAPVRNPAMPEVALASCGCPRLIAAACTASSGSVWYAGSTDEAAGYTYPPPPGKGAIFNVKAPGGTERLASLGGPLFEGVYGVLLCGVAGLAVAHWNLGLVAVACFIPGVANLVVALDSLRRVEDDKSRSDGWYVWHPPIPGPAP